MPRREAHAQFERVPIVVALLGAATALCAAGARAQFPSHSKVALISAESAVRPGEEVSLGLKFHLDPGWHTYWINPGDSGQAAFVRWQLPPGWQAGALQWPVPERIPDHSLIDYGYEREVLLISPTRVPESQRPGQSVKLGAFVQWLVCRDVCVPAQASVELVLPVTESSQYSRDRELFEATRKRLPAPQPAGWRARATADRDRFVLQIAAGHPLQLETFLPLDPGEVRNTPPAMIATWKRGARITLAKSEELTSTVSQLRGIVVLAPGRAFTIDAPLTPAPPRRGRQRGTSSP